MHLPEGLTPAEIRVLQEYRRLGKQELTVEEIKAIKHPVGGGETPATILAAIHRLVTRRDGVGDGLVGVNIGLEQHFAAAAVRGFFLKLGFAGFADFLH